MQSETLRLIRSGVVIALAVVAGVVLASRIGRADDHACAESCPSPHAAAVDE